MKRLIHISEEFSDGLKYRFVKYFRYNNVTYWKKYYKKKLKSNDVKREKLYASIIARYISKSDPKVLDIGSGFGFLLKEISALKINAYGVDLFPEMLEEAKVYLKGTNVKLQNADILDLPFNKEYFDCIILMSVLEHLSPKEVEEDILDYIKDFIKPGGYFFVHVPVRSPYSMFARFLRKFVFFDLPFWAIDDDGDITHKMWYSYKEYINLIESHGFEIVNFDFRTTRSNLKPKFMNEVMKGMQTFLDNSDPEFKLHYESEENLVKSLKKVKSFFALTSYMLFRKV